MTLRSTLTGLQFQRALDKAETSQNAFAKRIGVPQSTVYRWRHEKRSIPRIVEYELLALFDERKIDPPAFLRRKRRKK